jgi:hypothetical protein
MKMVVIYTSMTRQRGGEKGWSLDHRKPDGIKDHYSGGWYYLDEFQELDENCTNWNELDQGIF